MNLNKIKDPASETKVWKKWINNESVYSNPNHKLCEVPPYETLWELFQYLRTSDRLWYVKDKAEPIKFDVDAYVWHLSRNAEPKKKTTMDDSAIRMFRRIVKFGAANDKGKPTSFFASCQGRTSKEFYSLLIDIVDEDRNDVSEDPISIRFAEMENLREQISLEISCHERNRDDGKKYSKLVEAIAPLAPACEVDSKDVKNWFVGKGNDWPVVYHTLRQSEQDRMYVYSLTELFVEQNAHCLRFRNAMKTYSDGGVGGIADDKSTSGVGMVTGKNCLYFFGSSSEQTALKIMSFSISENDVDEENGMEIMRGFIMTHSPNSMLASRLLMFRGSGFHMKQKAEQFAGSNPYRFFSGDDEFMKTTDCPEINEFLFEEFSQLACCQGKNEMDQKSIFHSYLASLANRNSSGLGGTSRDIYEFPALII